MPRDFTKMSPRELVRHTLQRANIKDGDIIKVMADTPMARTDSVTELARRLGRTNRTRCIVVVVSDFSHLEPESLASILKKADDEIMAAAGWQRIPVEESEEFKEPEESDA